MKKNDNRNKLKLFVLIAVIILAIGYAIVTATLIVVKKNPINYFIIKESADNNDDTNTDGDKSKRNNNKGSSEIPENKENGKFYVHYVTNNNSPVITGGTGTATVSDDSLSAIFYINSIMSDNDIVYISYDIRNDSENYDADLDINLTNSNPEYFKVTKEINDKILRKNNRTKVTFKVELIKPPIENEETTTISGTIIAKPIKK